MAVHSAGDAAADGTDSATDGTAFEDCAAALPGPRSATPTPRHPGSHRRDSVVTPATAPRSVIAAGRRVLPRTTPYLPALLGLLSGLLVLGPGLGMGYLLRVDMVAVPHPPLKGALVGFSSTAPRAVPSDLVLTLLGHVLPADLAQKVLLLGIFVIAAAGVGELTRPYPLPARLTAAFFFTWNPYVAERLLIGHWALLYGYASMPWIAWAAGRVRGVRDRPTWGRMLLALCPAALGGFAAMIVAGIVVAGVSAVRRSRRTAVMGAVTWSLWALPWLLPSVLHSGGLTGDPGGADAFASRADSPFGAFGSLLMLGGIWNQQSVPDHFADAPLLVIRTALTLVALSGVVVQLRRREFPQRHRAVAVLVPSALLGLVIAALATVKPGLALVRTAITAVPALGAFRDAQQFAAPLALLEAVGLGAAVAATLAAPRLRDRGGLGYAATVILLPALALPQLAWGVGGALRPVHYPPDWAAVRRIVDSDPQPGAMLVLPLSAYRTYSWNLSAPVNDPATKAFARQVVADDTLVVDGTPVAGESPAAQRAAAAVASGGGRVGPDACRDLGVRYVLIEEATDPAALVVGLDRVYAGPDLTLYRVPG